VQGCMVFRLVFVFLLLTHTCSVLSETPIGENSSFNLNFSLRTSLGATKNGETEVAFKAPNAVTKFRLGNEADNNLKLAFEYRRFLDADMDREKKHIKLVFMLEGYDIQGNDVDANFSGLAQGYVSFNNFIKKGANVWVGRRWYDRKSIYMVDHFWLNTGQRTRAGAGIEGIKVLNSDFSAALLMSEDHAVRSTITGLAPTESVNSSALDFRLQNISVSPTSQLNLWVYANHRPQNVQAGLDAKSGKGLAVWHNTNMGNGAGRNIVHATYRSGTSVSRNVFNPNPILNAGLLDDINYSEVANDLVLSINEDINFGLVALYRSTNEIKNNTTETKKVLSVGIRPQYHISQHMSLIAEVGHDRVSYKEKDGNLTKLTLGFQLNVDKGYWSRPSIRAFITAAKWSDSFRGQIGGVDFSHQTAGFSAGIQAEWWWYKG